MLSKNNQTETLKRAQMKQPRFALRKLTIGVASVLMGITLYGVNGTVHADTTAPQTTETSTNQSASTSGETANFSKVGDQATDQNLPNVGTRDTTDSAEVIHVHNPGAQDVYQSNGSWTDTNNRNDHSQTVAVQDMHRSNFVLASQPALKYTDTFNFFAPDGQAVVNAQGQPVSVSESGYPGDLIPTDNLFNAIQQIEDQHPDWYLENLGLTVKFNDNDNRFNLYFNTKKATAVTETVTTEQDGQQNTKTYSNTMHAQYDYHNVLNQDVHDFIGWETLNFNHQLTVPAGYHAEITGVTVTPVTGKSSYNNEYGNAPQFANQLQAKLQKAIQDNNQQLPSYTLSDPVNVEFTVKFVKDNPVDPDQPTPTNPGKKDPDQPTPTDHQPVPETNNNNGRQLSTSATKAQVQSTTRMAQKNEQQALPQTGNDKDQTLLGLGAVTLLGMVGLAGLRKKRN
ncbi:LPXTG cell wall anchor domain-containing protein [Limosilactobacillus antri]|uniref:LPXTG cell wall anchor domain-containing protein n=1 Tax=Limosilactobacillus antri TaxID=227943 RepID=UPI001F57793A|nr:YSIRK-type signal peptide-containing protein [Limosilactobacillus antri]